MRTRNRTGLRGLALLCSGMLLFGCAGSDTADETQGTADEAAMEQTSAMTLGDLAGTWSMQVMSETGDTTLTTFMLTATADPASWTITFPDGGTVTGTVTLDGDSVMGDFGPYASQLREGLTVSVRSTIRMDGDQMIGTFVGTYETAEADSVLNGRLAGSRVMEEAEETEQAEEI